MKRRYSQPFAFYLRYVSNQTERLCFGRLTRIRLLERFRHDMEKRNLSISQCVMKSLPGEGEG